MTDQPPTQQDAHRGAGLTDQAPLLTRMAISELYFQLRGLLSDPGLQQVIAKFTGPDKVYIPPEGVQELQDQLIVRVLEKVIPIAWWDWEDKQEAMCPSGNQTEQQWCVWYGGPDPDNAAGREIRDDEADAREALQWLRDDLGAGVAVRDLHITPWRAVDPGVSR